MIKSPIRYPGNKLNLLPVILNNLPRDYSKVIDAFGGSGVVIANIPAKVKLYNEADAHVFKMIASLISDKPSTVCKYLRYYVKQFQLTADNKDGYLKFRAYANKKNDYLLFYLLHLHSFSNGIRFSSTGFSHPFGKRSRLRDLDTEIFYFHKALQNIQFSNLHYGELLRKIKHQLSEKVFIYFDPPYLASGHAGYACKWTKDDDAKLMRNLVKLDKLGVKWMMSNVLSHRHYTNKTLAEWSKSYNVLNVDGKAVYRFSREVDPLKKTQEVLITNY